MPSKFKNKLTFDIDGNDGDNILFLYNEVSFLPQRFSH